MASKINALKCVINLKSFLDIQYLIMTFWWVQCKWIINTWIKFLVKYAWLWDTSQSLKLFCWPFKLFWTLNGHRLIQHTQKVIRIKHTFLCLTQAASMCPSAVRKEAIQHYSLLFSFFCELGNLIWLCYKFFFLINT